MLHIVAVLTVLALFMVIVYSCLSGKMQRRLQRAREINALTSEMLRVQDRRRDWLEEHDSDSASCDYQQILLEQEIQLRLAFSEFDPTHPFLQPVEGLLGECTDEEFIAWGRSKLNDIDWRNIKFVT